MDHGCSTAPAPRAFRKCFNGRLFYAVTLIAFSQLNFGMDQGAFAGTQTMTAFERKFGVWDEGQGKYIIEPYFLSLLNSLNYVGFAFGLVSGNFISRKWGRRMCMLTMCCWAIVAAIILVTSQHKAQMLVGRIVAYVYIGMELALVPVLQSELVPARVRGFVVGTYQSGLLFGQLIMSLICQRTAKIEGDPSWRIPLGLFFIVPSLLLCGVWFLPESPRWLFMQDRSDDAMRSLRLLREGKFTDDEIKAESHEIQRNIDLTVDRGHFKELFQGTNLKRTLIVIGVNVFLQLTGQNFSSIYGTIFIKSLNTIDPFAMTAINSGINIFMVFVTQGLTDITGRVPLMVAGAVVQCIALFTMGGLGAISDPSVDVMKSITSMLTIFGAGFQIGWAPLSHVVAAEIPTTRLRDFTYTLGAVFNIAIQFAVSFSIPYLLNAPYANLGSKVGFIFGATAFGAVLFSWFCIPECSGKTLEEVDELFLEGVRIKDFRRMKGRTRVEELKGGEAECHETVYNGNGA